MKYNSLYDEIERISDALLLSWKPVLNNLRISQFKDISDAAFCGVVAFMGIHLSLWPQWLNIWKEQIDEEERSFDIVEEISLERPWLCLNLAYGKNTLLSHVQTEGVSINRAHINMFLKPNISHMFRSLNEQGIMIPYELAVNDLILMGYTDYDNASFIVKANDALPEMSKFEKKQNPSTKKIPIVSLNLIEEEQEDWLHLAKLTGEILSVFLKPFSADRLINPDAKDSYSYLAARLWSKLVMAKVINPFGEKSTGFRRFMKPKQDSYRGNLLIYGDHESFWRKFNQLLD